MRTRRAKIVCTLGPSSSDYGVIKEMVLAGMDVARLNFSHGTHEQHARMIDNLRRVAHDTGRIVGIMLDLQGPKVRVGRFGEGQVTLRRGEGFTITGREVEGSAQRVSTTYGRLADDVRPGDEILLDDGLLALRVREVDDLDVHCEVTTGGVLKNNKGINLPGTALSVDTLTDKDFADVDFGLAHGVDFIAMSFVRQPADILQLREYLAGRQEHYLPIIAKIEKPQALEHMDAIVEAADSIMVARGDLGVELPPEDVPAIQKELIAAANREGKPVITATQMLESMVSSPRPTRAEASDVANAILDGSDAVMLSAESASGHYPVEAIAVMQRIIEATEAAGERADPARRRRRDGAGPLPVHEGIAVTACTLSELVDARCIASVTLTGSMSRLIAKHRPAKQIYAISQFEFVLRQLTLIWGIHGVLMPDLTSHIDEALAEVEARLRDQGLVQRGDRMLLTAGVPFSERKATNMVRVDEVK